MLPSSNSFNPFDHFMFKRPYSSFHDDQNPSSKQDNPSLFTSFPSPIFDEHELPLNQILSQHQPDHQIIITAQQYPTKEEPSKNMNNVLMMSNGHRKEANGSKPNKGINARVSRNLGVVPRRRTGKKDRHSKICTAQGIRDRRMRLSLQVARKFFDLQDVLGYDKASKTIEWLFNKSKKAINELTKDCPSHNMSISNNDAKSESLISECEVVSAGIEVEENSNNCSKGINAPILPVDLIPEHNISTTLGKPNLTKGAREEARARARCRTREKMLVKGLDVYAIQGPKSNPNGNGFKLSNPNECYFDPEIGSSSNTLFDAADHQEAVEHIQDISGLPKLCDTYETFEPEKINDTGTIEKLLGYTSSSSSPSSCLVPDSGYSNPNAAFMGSFGIWDMFNDGKMNTIQYGVTNQVSFAGNPDSVIYSATPHFL